MSSPANSSKNEDERFGFSAEWFDRQASLVRRYTIVLYTIDGTIEVYDVKNHRLFLRRTKVDGVSLADLRVGGYVNLLGRSMLVVDFADEYTRNKLSTRNEKTFAMIKPDSVRDLGAILEMIQGVGLQVTRLRMARFDRKQAAEFYSVHVGKPFFSELVEYLSSGPVVGLELTGSSAVAKWRDLLGLTDPDQARRQNPLSIRAKFALDKTRNAAHGADSAENAARELELFFGSCNFSKPTAHGSTISCGSNGGLHLSGVANFRDSTLLLVKPHAVIAGQAGKILSYLKSPGGFNVTAASIYYLDKANAEEFLQVYKGVVPEYTNMVEELISGPVLAVEVTKDGLSGEQVVNALREFAGPHDPEIGRHLRPRSLRAMFGVDKIRNVIHCTDLADDGPLEVEYFFKLLDA